MHRSLRLGLFGISLFLVFSTVSVTESKAQNVLGEILRRMDANNKALQSLTAAVTMVKYNPQLNVSDTTTGTTSYLPKTKLTGNKRYIRIDWTQPVQEQIAVIEDSYELYRPRLNQVIVGKTSGAKNNASVGGALGFMSMSKEQLKANYDVVFIGEEEIKGGIKTWHLQLTPKTAQSYKMADLWVDGDGMPRQAKVTEQNNDTTEVLLSNIQKNGTIQTKIFKLSYPGNVKKIKA
jgi:outer membrane lipoprotein-sorting protein